MVNKKLALVTGASNGIGLELSWLLAKDNYDLILIARNFTALEELKESITKHHKVNITVFSIDLSTENGMFEAGEIIKKTKPSVLINNAGFGTYGEITITNLNAEKQMIDLNIKALTVLTKIGAQMMKENRHGKIMNIASLAAFQPGPLMAVYYASKAYVLSFSEAVHIELQGTGVTVTSLCPGATETGFEKAAGLEKSRLFKMSKPMAAKEVAEYGYNAMLKGKRVAIPGFQNQIMALSSQIVSRGLAARVAKYMQGEVK